MAIELITDAGGDPMVSIPEGVLQGALRRDLWLLLDLQWQFLLEEPRLLLMAVANPAPLFDLEVCLGAFAAYLVPSQVLRCAEAGATWVVYNPLLTHGLRQH